MTMFLFFLAFATGYTASIYSWSMIKVGVNGARAEITSLETRAAVLKAAL